MLYAFTVNKILSFIKIVELIVGRNILHMPLLSKVAKFRSTHGEEIAAIQTIHVIPHFRTLGLDQAF